MAEPLVPRVLVVVCDSWGVGDAPDADAYGDDGSDTLGQHRRRRWAACALRRSRSSAWASSPRSRASRRRAAAGNRARPRHGGLGRQGHHHRALGDDGDPARRTVPAVSPRVPARDHRAVRGRDRPPGPGQRPRLGDRDHRRARGANTCGPGGPSSTRAATACSRSRATRTSCRLEQLYEWCATARSLLTGPHLVGPGDRAAVRRARAGRVRPQPGAPGLRGAAAGPHRARRARRRRRLRCSAWARSRTSSAATASRRAATPTPTTTASTSPWTTCRRPEPAFVFTNLVDFDSKYGHRNDPTRVRGARSRPSTRGCPRSSRRLGGGVLLITGDHGCDPTTPPPTTPASAPRCWRPASPGDRTRSGPGDVRGPRRHRGDAPWGRGRGSSRARASADRLGYA